ncbi:putative quinone oxidoreductase [Dorcoceras hygrometricum]|uniref:Putative quinone oxidoreductase n=1 Tax=Dorcoceras hygrometricum TaxID=472368 RepID=A0A2Z7CDQ6_9LAMI|nr:putative quinone oxidoreductase [Dorcoceras hygrometricum]
MVTQLVVELTRLVVPKVVVRVSSPDRSSGLVHATAASARELSTDLHITLLICQLAPNLVQLENTQQASKMNSTNYTSSALQAATKTPATLNSLLSYDQHMPLNQLAPVPSKLKPKASSCITSLARTVGSDCIRVNPPHVILSKLEESRLVATNLD